MANVEALLKETVGELDKLLNTKNVLGEPIERDGATVIPIVSFGFGFGAGGKTDSKSADGGGAGGGGGIKPLGAIIFDKDGPRVEGIKGAVSSVAEIIKDTATAAIEKRAKGNSEGKAKAAQKE